MEKKLLLLWIALILLTLLSWNSGATKLLNIPRWVLAAWVLGLAFFKVRIVILDFMEVRHAPLPLRLTLELWIVLVCGVLVAAYAGLISAF